MSKPCDLTKRQLWQKRFSEYAEKSISVLEFCRCIGVPTQTFYYWRRQLRDVSKETLTTRVTASRSKSADAAKPHPSFLPVVLERSLTASRSMEVTLRTGARIQVPVEHHGLVIAVIESLLKSEGA